MEFRDLPPGRSRDERTKRDVCLLLRRLWKCRWSRGKGSVEVSVENMCIRRAQMTSYRPIEDIDTTVDNPLTFRLQGFRRVFPIHSLFLDREGGSWQNSLLAGGLK